MAMKPGAAEDNGAEDQEHTPTCGLRVIQLGFIFRELLKRDLSVVINRLWFPYV
jgi:hypothetical protein